MMGNDEYVLLGGGSSPLCCYMITRKKGAFKKLFAAFGTNFDFFGAEAGRFRITC